MKPEMIQSNRCHEGRWNRYRHRSVELDCDMNFSIYHPPETQAGKGFSLLWLSGLTCTDRNFVEKAHAEACAAALGITLLVPDTSPRGAGIVGEDDDWDLGTGAAFYLDATQEPWSRNYRMESYLIREFLPGIESCFDISMRALALSGHSMGGHGALTLGLKNPDLFQSVSAFSPICAPSECAWGQKAFRSYLGPESEDWANHDACALIRGGARLPKLRVEQGLADEFLEDQLKPSLLQAVCKSGDQALELYYREDYDHSYFFISTFIAEHLQWHSAVQSAP